MCGIAGIVPSRDLDPAQMDRWVRRMCQSMVHRGPDGEGVFIAPDIGIGARRLAIIDIENGGQPMYSADGRHAIVFNGEIYNYVALRGELQRRGCTFATNCDTEVVLRLFEVFGRDAFERLEGMFGVAVWDQAEKRLTIARDWLGQKSVYWTRCQFGWAFASEIKALLVLPGVQRRMDLAALSHYMSMRYLPGEHTFFDGIYKLPAAHALEVTRSGAQATRLWTPKYEPKLARDEGALLDELDSLLGTVVGEHLMSDVPLGAFLSGGIDSSLMVAYAARAAKEPLRTFSVGVDDESQSELPWARMVAERYGTRHTETIQNPDLASLTPRMVAALEEPVDPFACGVYVVSRAAAKHVKVAIGGDGGDELFAGYDRYKGQELAELYSHVPRALRHKLLRPLLRRFPDTFGYNSFASKLRWIDEAADFDGFERYAHSVAILRFTHPRKQALFTHSAWARIGTAMSEKLLEQYFRDGSASAFVDQMLHADCMTRLADDQLPITDKMAMAHSLELRSPFLDRRVAEFAMRIPTHLKMKGRRVKYVTRRLAERYLPRELVHRRKQGFGFPLALWLRGRLRPLLRRAIEESRLAEAGVFRSDEMLRLAQEHWSGTNDHNYRLWMLFNLEVFWRHYIDGVGVEELEEWIASSMSDERVSAAATSAAEPWQDRLTLQATRQNGPQTDEPHDGPRAPFANATVAQQPAPTATVAAAAAADPRVIDGTRH
jgi:asparagine synthase (glutamine-hydrolysing)